MKRAAFDLAAAVKTAKPGAVIAVPGGRHVLRAPLIVVGGLTLRGRGTIVGSRGRAVIRVEAGGRLTAEGLGFERTGKELGSVIECAGTLVLRRCTVTGGNDRSSRGTRGGVVAVATAKVTIVDCAFVQPDTTIAIHVAKRSVATVQRTKFRGAFCAVQVGDDARATVRANTVTRCKLGFVFADRAAGQARDNTLTDLSNAVHVSGRSKARIENNTIDRCKLLAVVIYDDARPVVTGNVIRRAEHSGIEIKDRAAPTLVRNRIEKCGWHGISVVDRAGGVLRDNVLVANKRHGMLLWGRSKPTADRNTCRENNWSGIAIGMSSGAVVSANHCHANDTHGMVVLDRSTPRLTRNVLDDNVGYGLWVDNTARPASTGDRIEDNGRGGIILQGKTGGSYERVQVIDNDGYGIVIDGSAAPKVVGCTIADSERSGIYVCDAARPVLADNTIERNGEEGIEYSGRSAGTARGNRCRANEGSGIRLYGHPKPVLSGNTCTGNEGHGILVEENTDGVLAKPTLRNNTARANGEEDGIGTKLTLRAATAKLAGTFAKRYLRAAYQPTLKAGDGAPTDSKFGGTPCLARGEAWPVCTNCSRPMPLFVQLDLAKLPARGLGRGFLQLFYCTNEDESCHDHDTEVLRVVPKRKAPAVKPPITFPPKRIVGWRQHAEVINWIQLGDGDRPRQRLARVIAEAGCKYYDGDDDVGSGPELSPELGDKLLGWPAFINEPPSSLRCHRCHAPMRLLFQIDSEHALPWMWGDAGVAFIFQCPTHVDDPVFIWQCF